MLFNDIFFISILIIVLFNNIYFFYINENTRISLKMDDAFLDLFENLESIGFFKSKSTSSFDIKLKEFLREKKSFSEKFDLEQKMMKSTILRHFYLIRVPTDKILELKLKFNERSVISTEYFSELVDILSKHLFAESRVPTFF